MEFQHKRQNHAVQNQSQARYGSGNPDTEALSTLGMRIRKAVSDGYNTPNASSYSYGDQSYVNRRVPLPAGMDEPPSLVGSTGSTVGTASNLSDWGNTASVPVAHPVTIPENPVEAFTKRKFEANQDTGYSRYRENVDYGLKYGNLLFNEEF